MEQAGIQLIASGAAAFDADMKSATAATNRFVDATEHGGGRVSKAGQIMTGALREIGSLATQAFVQAARATVDFVGDSVKLAGDFEAGMNAFRVAAGREMDTSGLKQFHDLFLQLGKDLPVSTAEVQMAATEMVKGGIDPATLAAGGLKQNILFAAAAMEGDLVKAAEISSKIVGGWGAVGATAAEKADLLTHATDMMTKAANASQVNVEGLSLGIFNAQGIAKVAGVSFDDLTTTLAALAPRFESSSVAGNSLKNMIARLQPTTDPATQAMMSLGLYTEDAGTAFYDAQGNFVGFEAAAQLLQDSLKGLTKEQQAATLQQIFGNDAMGAAAALAELGSAGYQEMADSIGKAMGVAEAGAALQGGFNTALDNARGSVETLKISLGEHLLPILTDLLNNTIAPGINAFGDWAGAILSADDPMQALVKGIDDLVPGFASFVSGAETAIGILIAVGDAVGGVVRHFSTATVGSGELGGAVDDLSGVWAKAQLVIGNVMDAYMHIAEAVLPLIQRFVAEHGAEIEAFFQTTWKTVIEIIHLALDTYNAIVPPVLNAIAGFIEAHGSEILKIMGGAWDMITSLITGTLETIKGVFHVALALINGDWDGAWNGIKGIADTQVKAIEGVITGFLNIIAGIFDTDVDAILKTWEDNWNTALDIINKIDWAAAGESVVEGIISGIGSMAGELFSALEQMAQDAYDAFMKKIKGGSPAKEFEPAGQSMIQGIMQGLSDQVPGLMGLITQTGDDMIKALTKNIEEGTKKITAEMNALIEKVKDIGRDMQGAIADSFGATASIDRQIAKNLDAFKDVLPRYAQYTTGALKEAQSQAEGFLDPAEGAKFFALRSKQILEYAKLQKELAEAETVEDRKRIEAQMLLINRAQTAEISQFNANQGAQQSAAEQMAESINDVMKALAGVDLTDEQIKIVDMLSGMWAGLQNQGNARQQAYANPPQMQYPGGGNTTTSSTRTINMPIYTNNTPAAIADSWAILQASMP